MKGLLLDGENDALHTSDWLLTENGCLAATSFKLQPGNDLHDIASGFGAKIHSLFPCVQAVYLRGSALESNRRDLVKDVDIIAVIERTAQERCAEIGQAASELWPLQDAPRCDFEIAYSDRLKKQSFSTVTQLILAFRAGLLAGTAVWPEAPRVKADAALALRIQSSHRRFVQRFLGNANAAPDNYDPVALVAWMQKKTLRLGGILSMGVSQRFSRHPVRCATLIAETHPGIGTLAAEVARQYTIGQSNESAWRTARQLFASLCWCGDRLETQWVRAITERRVP